ncbi:MAG TPA: hypothetical protein VMB20_13235 [Candidatus Acidoferrum sp.]|nr:hypothetical protein [Candidatus Acidoferrum sp.]
MRSGEVGIAVLTALMLAAGTARAQQTASMDLLRRATDPNPALNSYTGTAHLSATLHILVPLHKEYDGNVYYLRPERKIEFKNVAGSLSKFKDLVTSTPSYDDAMTQYTITPQSDDGTHSSYLLVPKKPGSRVKSLTVRVNDQSTLIERAQWAYTNGGTLRFDETYTTVATFHLPAAANIAARFPDYSVDGTITFANYVPNAPVAPSVFASPKPR